MGRNNRNKKGKRKGSGEQDESEAIPGKNIVVIYDYKDINILFLLFVYKHCALMVSKTRFGLHYFNDREVSHLELALLAVASNIHKLGVLALL